MVSVLHRVVALSCHCRSTLLRHRPPQTEDVLRLDKFNMAVGEGDVGTGILFAVAVGDNIIRSVDLIPSGSTLKKQY